MKHLYDSWHQVIGCWLILAKPPTPPTAKRIRSQQLTNRPDSISLIPTFCCAIERVACAMISTVVLPNLRRRSDKSQVISCHDRLRSHDIVGDKHPDIHDGRRQSSHPRFAGHLVVADLMWCATFTYYVLSICNLYLSKIARSKSNIPAPQSFQFGLTTSGVCVYDRQHI